jgi:hypothetical protein
MMTRVIALLSLAGMLAVAVAEDNEKKKDPILEAIELPIVAQKLREGGAETKDVAKVLIAERSAGLSAAEASHSLKAMLRASKEHGQLASVGDFVKAQIADGKRGKDLATAITEEYAAKAVKADKSGAKDAKGKGEAKAKDAKGKGEAKAKDAKGKGEAKAKDAKGKGEAKAKEGKGKGEAKAKDAKGKGEAKAKEAKGKGEAKAKEAKGKKKEDDADNADGGEE